MYLEFFIILIAGIVLKATGQNENDSEKIKNGDILLGISLALIICTFLYNIVYYRYRPHRMKFTRVPSYSL